MAGGTDNDETQPKRNETGINNRVYIPAVWKPLGEGGGNPKISGGRSVSRNLLTDAPNGLNRPKQRYVQPSSELVSRREQKALSEYSLDNVLRRSSAVYNVRSNSGNIYDCVIDPDFAFTNGEGFEVMCQCPDDWRLRKSGYTFAVRCKHSLMAEIRESEAALNPIDYCTDYIAEVTGFDVRSIQAMCQNGEFPCSKLDGRWRIAASDFEAAVAYIENLKVYPYMPLLAIG